MTNSPSATDLYPIYEVRTASTGTDEATHIVAPEHRDEQMGSKRKFWLRDPRTSLWYLFKFSRENTGEHWSEKIACECARLLGLPHAEVELAKHDDAWGVLVKDIRADRKRSSLLHGNELLLELDPAYPAKETYRVSEHTVERVAEALRTYNVMLPDSSALARELPPGVEDALGVFVGYLLLDAIIGNTDRHHENWAVVGGRDSSGSRVLQLASTYDHASSLGRELLDPKRIARLKGTKRHGVDGYAEKTRSAFYRTAGDSSAMSPRDAFVVAGRLRPTAAKSWRSRCDEVGAEAFERLLDRLPRSCASDAAVTFAQAMIRYNCRAVLDNREVAG
jgi:hypothetical protein